MTPDVDEELAGLLGPSGAVARALESAGFPYEERAEQRRMATAVAAALSSRRHVVVEAGTGVGKSFAYLVPALRWAKAEGKKVAVATSTIALQEQLVRKDLPLLAKALPFGFTFALVKGRSNYLCKRRLGLALADPGGLFARDEAIAELDAIREWAQTTREGSRQDLPAPVSDEVWDAVRAEHGNCLHRACPHYAACPYQRRRQLAHEADLLVLNHHILMADLVLKGSGVSFLPAVDALVVDEAHALEDVAAEHLGRRVGAFGIANALGRLWNARGKGLLARLKAKDAERDVERVRGAAKDFFADLGTWLESRAATGGLARVEDPFPVPDSLTAPLRSLAVSLEAAVAAAPERDLAMETAARARAVGALADEVETLAGAGVEGEVRWVETQGRSVSVASAPVDVASRLKEVLWQTVGTVVLTSATLAAGSPPSFEYLRRRLGLEEADELIVGSPFDYVRQARIVVRADLPDPVREPRRFEESLPDAVRAAVRASGGGAFVLFTSVSAMRAVAAAVRADLVADGLEVLVQGEGIDRARMLERFREVNSVLFGVASFWQGVDVPGDALRHVVIARLPFEVPTHPLQEARRERIERTGGDAFSEMSLPAAALRLKQGFGRLIRRASDTGRVTILDPRIVTREYGRFLLDSLPPCPVEITDGDAADAS